MDLNGVRSELFSRVVKDAHSKYYSELTIDEVTSYVADISNPEDQEGYDLIFYLVVEPL